MKYNLYIELWNGSRTEIDERMVLISLTKAVGNVMKIIEAIEDKGPGGAIVTGMQLMGQFTTRQSECLHYVGGIDFKQSRSLRIIGGPSTERVLWLRDDQGNISEQRVDFSEQIPIQVVEWDFWRELNSREVLPELLEHFIEWNHNSKL